MTLREPPTNAVLRIRYGPDRPQFRPVEVVWCNLSGAWYQIGDERPYEWDDVLTGATTVEAAHWLPGRLESS